MNIELKTFLILALATATPAWTVAKSRVFAWLRSWLPSLHMLRCPWCLSFYFALVFAALNQSYWLDIVTLWLALVAGAGIIGGVLDKLIGWSEAEVEAQRKLAREAQEALRGMVDIVDAPYAQMIFEVPMPPGLDDWTVLRSWYRRLTR